MNPKPPRAARPKTTRTARVAVKIREERAGWRGERGREPRKLKWGGESGLALTVRVALLPDPVNSAVGVNAQEEAPVFAVQPLGVLEVAGREGAAAAILGQGGQRGDAPGCHGPSGALPGTPSRWSRAGSRRSPAPAPASDPLRGTAPAPAPQPPAWQRAAAPAVPQPRAVRPLFCPPAPGARRAGGPGAGVQGWLSPRTPPGESRLPNCSARDPVATAGTASANLAPAGPRRHIFYISTPDTHQPPAPPALLPPARRPLLARGFWGLPLSPAVQPQHASARDIRPGGSPASVGGGGGAGEGRGARVGGRGRALAVPGLHCPLSPRSHPHPTPHHPNHV